jgi:NAD(P)H-hydrate repair Nnr-like enzyme with NAD(P)H-hydrate epimerase domain
MTNQCQSCGIETAQTFCFECYGLRVLEQVHLPRNIKAHDHELNNLEHKVLQEEAKIQECKAKLASNHFHVDGLLAMRLKQRHQQKQNNLVKRIAEKRVLKGV